MTRLAVIDTITGEIIRDYHGGPVATQRHTRHLKQQGRPKRKTSYSASHAAWDHIGLALIAAITVGCLLLMHVH